MDLKGRHFLKLLDFSPAEIDHLLRLAAELKQARRAGSERQQLTGKSIALIFEKASTRTRCAFEVAAYDQGAQVTYLDPSGSQLGKKESIRDTARVLGRMYHGIEYRGFEQSRVEDLARARGRAGLERAHQRVPPHAGAGRRPDHAGALRQASEAGGLRLPGRRPQQRGQLAPGRRRQAGHGLPHRRPAGAAAQPRAGADRARRSRRRPGPGSRSAPTSPGGSRAAISSTPMSGCPWASPMPCGRSASGC